MKGAGRAVPLKRGSRHVNVYSGRLGGWLSRRLAPRNCTWEWRSTTCSSRLCRLAYQAKRLVRSVRGSGQGQCEGRCRHPLHAAGVQRKPHVEG